MKRFLPILLCLVLFCIVLSACGDRKNEQNETAPATKTEVETNETGEIGSLFDETKTEESGGTQQAPATTKQEEVQTTENKPPVTTTKLVEIGGITFEGDGNSGNEDLTTSTTTKPSTTTKKPTTTTKKGNNKPTTTTTKRTSVETPPVMLNPKK